MKQFKIEYNLMCGKSHRCHLVKTPFMTAHIHNHEVNDFLARFSAFLYAEITPNGVYSLSLGDDEGRTTQKGGLICYIEAPTVNNKRSVYPIALPRVIINELGLNKGDLRFDIIEAG